MKVESVFSHCGIKNIRTEMSPISPCRSIGQGFSRNDDHKEEWCIPSSGQQIIRFLKSSTFFQFLNRFDCSITCICFYNLCINIRNHMYTERETRAHISCLHKGHHAVYSEIESTDLRMEILSVFPQMESIPWQLIRISLKCQRNHHCYSQSFIQSKLNLRGYRALHDFDKQVKFQKAGTFVLT